MKWPLEKATEMAAHEEPECRKRGLYRLGMLHQNQGEYEESVKNFQEVKLLDPGFYREHVHIREAEGLYKMNKIAETFAALTPIENELKEKNKYLVHMLKGKCHDRLKEHAKAALEYE